MHTEQREEHSDPIPRILTGDLRKPQLEWLMLRKIPQVQESLKVQCEGMLEVVSTHEGFEEIDVEYEVEKVYQSNDNGREKGDIENEDDAGAEDKKYVDERA